MVTFDEIGSVLDEIAMTLPTEFYRELNGGVNLLPGIKLHPESRDSGNLYIMGEYVCDPRGLGRYINIYYGSFVQVYGYADPERRRQELQNILVHEFTHHLESLAGEKGLERKDADAMEKFRRGFLR